jgi:DNA-binding LytR/AlgR family response regulator
MELNCMVVDDDDMSRSIVKHYIQKTNFLTLQHECTSAIEAANLLKEGDTDIIFLDVEMPEMTGMELIKTLESYYEIILITSNKDYAVEAFEKSVTDYLVKPIDYSRFLIASSKAKKNIENINKANEKQKDIYVRSDSKMIRISLSDLLFVEALADYVIFNTIHKKHIVHYTMKGIEKRLPGSYFSRIHRSFIINTEFIDAIEDNSVIIGEKYIPIGASYKDSFMESLNFL